MWRSATTGGHVWCSRRWRQRPPDPLQTPRLGPAARWMRKNPERRCAQRGYKPGHNSGGSRVQFLQLVISGIAQGCIYGLIALGFVLIYKATETVSFAQGELMMLGAFAGLACLTLFEFPFWLAVIA